MTPREEIEKIKSDLAKSIEKNSLQYKRAIIREMDFLFKKYGQDNIDILASVVKKKFNIPAAAMKTIMQELKKSQRQIGKLWLDYFHDTALSASEGDAIIASALQELGPNDYEKLIALYQVDFAEIKKSTREIIVNEIRRAAKAGKGYEVLRSRLTKRGLGDGEARTLANTSLAQFDNATMFEFAQQAGINKFLYDGVLHEHSRLFCREHLGVKYTVAEIKKMDNGQGLPVETSCGGYNCTHFWTPVIIGVTDKSKNINRKIIDPAAKNKMDRDVPIDSIQQLTDAEQSIIDQKAKEEFQRVTEFLKKSGKDVAATNFIQVQILKASQFGNDPIVFELGDFYLRGNDAKIKAEELSKLTGKDYYTKSFSSRTEYKKYVQYWLNQQLLRSKIK
ncbi:MAG: hypothetical protein WCW35_14580 [Bacteroidota bacterium]|jgi:hypothetical protein